jgi:hypothetical protein
MVRKQEKEIFSEVLKLLDYVCESDDYRQFYALCPEQITVSTICKRDHPKTSITF